MDINIFSIVFIFINILNIFFRRIRGGKKYFCIVSGFIYFLMAALRSWMVGTDTFYYVSAFELLSEKNLKFAINYSEKEKFFYLFLSFLGKFTSNYTILFIIVSGFFVISVWYFIYKYSKDPMLSIIILLSMNLYQFSLTGMRQTIAISFVIWVIITLDSNKIKTGVLLVIFGSLFHKSCLIFSLIILLKNIKFSVKVVKISPLILIGCFLFRKIIAKNLIGFIKERGYDIDMSQNGLTMLFVIFILYVIAILFMKNYKKNNSVKLQYIISFIAVFFEILVTVQAIFFRIAFYFLIIYIIIIPNTLVNIKNKNTKLVVQKIIYLLLSIQYLVYTIGSGSVLPYTTYWQV